MKILLGIVITVSNRNVPVYNCRISITYWTSLCGFPSLGLPGASVKNILSFLPGVAPCAYGYLLLPRRSRHSLKKMSQSGFRI